MKRKPMSCRGCELINHTVESPANHHQEKGKRAEGRVVSAGVPRSDISAVERLACPVHNTLRESGLDAKNINHFGRFRKLSDSKQLQQMSRNAEKI